MSFDRRFLIWGLSYAVLGLSLGIYMAASNNHGELVTHAHILMIGFLLSLIYALIHRLWLENPNRTVANLQFILHQAAAITVSAGLFLIFGGWVAEATLGPVLGVASAGVLLGMLLMLFMVVRSGRARVTAGS